MLKKLNKLKEDVIIRAMNFYPPFIGAGIKTKITSTRPYAFRSEMKLTPYNRNFVGTHFGGSLLAMTDPFFMLILIKELGSDYIVWDKETHINFIRPGKSKVHADFNISDEQIEEIKKQVELSPKSYRPVFEVHIYDKNNEVVATVKKTISIKKKRLSE